MFLCKIRNCRVIRKEKKVQAQKSGFRTHHSCTSLELHAVVLASVLRYVNMSVVPLNSGLSGGFSKCI